MSSDINDDASAITYTTHIQMTCKQRRRNETPCKNIDITAFPPAGQQFPYTSVSVLLPQQIEFKPTAPEHRNTQTVNRTVHSAHVKYDATSHVATATSQIWQRPTIHFDFT